jgi:2-amino-4-hydroxy-6-hydroxymethyldihydropteridine diphosphokinase
MAPAPAAACSHSGGLSNSRTVVIAFGSNLGDRRAAIAFAAEHLASVVSNLQLSELVETEPEGEGLEWQPPYLNAVGTGQTTLGARALLEALLGIERAFGRARPYRGAPRTLDLDLILLGDEIVHESGLDVPHPRFRERFFVLGPLAGLAPDLVDPETGLRVGQLLKRLLRNETR